MFMANTVGFWSWSCCTNSLSWAAGRCRRKVQSLSWVTSSVIRGCSYEGEYTEPMWDCRWNITHNNIRICNHNYSPLSQYQCSSRSSWPPKLWHPPNHTQHYRNEMEHQHLSIAGSVICLWSRRSRWSKWRWVDETVHARACNGHAIVVQSSLLVIS